MLNRLVMTGAAMLALWGTAASAADPPAAARPNVSATAPQPAQSAGWLGRKGYDAWKAHSDISAFGGAIGGPLPLAHSASPVAGIAAAGQPGVDTGSAQSNTNPYYAGNGLAGEMVPAPIQGNPPVNPGQNTGAR